MECCLTTFAFQNLYARSKQNNNMPEITVQIPEKRLGKREYAKLPDYEKGHYVKNIIKKTVEVNYPNGVTARQIRQSLEIDARTVDKHLTSMIHTGEIYNVKYDRTMVYLPNTRAMHPVLEETFTIDDKTKLHIYQLRNRLGDFIYIQERKKIGHTEEIESGIQVPLEKFPDFVEHMKKSLVEMMKRR